MLLEKLNVFCIINTYFRTIIYQKHIMLLFQITSDEDFNGFTMDGVQCLLKISRVLSVVGQVFTFVGNSST